MFYNRLFLNYFVITFSIIYTCSDGANILGIIPTASFSHQLPFRRLWKELSLRGHNVTVLTTDPIGDPTLTNLTEIDLHDLYQIVEKYNFAEVASDDTKSFLEIADVIRNITNETNYMVMNNPKVQSLIHNKDNNFDVLLVEAQLPAMMAFSWHFKCPFIGIASLDCALQYHDSAGNTVHPVLNPDPNLPIEDYENMSFKERIISLVFILLYRYRITNTALPKTTETMREFFGNDLPYLGDIQKNLSMLFLNTHPLFHTVRPIMPNTITLGSGMHIQEPKELPQELQSFLDNNDDYKGVVYFSLGSNVKGKMLNDTTKREIFKAFAEIPYKVLVKLDENIDSDLSRNVLVRKWMPQQDILRHPNIKLFISQGGLQSLQEATLNGIPVLGIPFFGDQIMNVKRMVKTVYGVQLHKHNITKASLKAAILEVVGNPTYKHKAVQIGEILRDVQTSDLEKAIWWTEYVIRHRGESYWKNPSVDLPLWKLYMLDVLGLLFFVVVSLIFIIYFTVKILLKIITLLTVRKNKVKTL